jgi:membrane protein
MDLRNTRDGIVSLVSLWWQQFRRLLDELNQQTGGWLGVFGRAAYDVFEPDSSQAAAAIAYFTLISLFPLTLFTIAIASVWLDPQLVEGDVVQRLEFVAPALGQLLGQNIERIVIERSSATGFAVITLLWSGSTIFHAITRSLDTIWEVGKRRPVWRHRGLALVTALTLSIILLMVSLVGSTVATVLNTLVSAPIRTFYSALSHLFPPILSVLLFGLLYYFLPHTKITVRDITAGALVGGLLWELAKRGFLHFVANYLSLSNLVYGSVATLIAFLAWAYISSIIFLFGAHLNVGYRRLRRERILTEKKPA